MSNKTCQVCGKYFSIPFAWEKRGGGIFCSTECYNSTKSKRVKAVCIVCGKEFTYQRHRPTDVCGWMCRVKKKQVIKVCIVCGESFTVPKSNADRYNVCSKACKTKNTIYKSCERCGKVFTGSSRGDSHYCSEECRRPPVIKECPTCGKEFRSVPALDQIYCSTSCYRKSTGETSPERNVRICLESLSIEYIQEHTFSGWNYPVDFFLPKYNIVIEVDGEYWHSKQSIKDRDKRKTDWLISKGYKVFRISDSPYYGKVTNEMINSIKSLIH